MLITANGLPVISARVRLPRTGIWNAELRLSTAKKLDSVVTLKTQDSWLTLNGTVVRQAVFANVIAARIVGGNGGLGKAVPAKFYQGVPAKLVLSDTLGAVGETLSSSSDASIVGTNLPKWTRTADQAGATLVALADYLNASFRVRDDGSIWVGKDTYPAISKTPDFVVTSRDPEDLRLTLRSSLPFLEPNVSFKASGDTIKVSYVLHAIDPDATVSTVYYEP